MADFDEDVPRVRGWRSGGMYPASASPHLPPALRSSLASGHLSQGVAMTASGTANRCECVSPSAPVQVVSTGSVAAVIGE